MSNHRTRGGIWKRLVSGVLCLALVLGLLPSGTVLPVHAASWAEPYAKQLVDWGVMRGDISGNLNLDRPITRAEFVTMINRAYGYDKLGGTPFTDVPSRQWYAQDIDIAYNAGYFKGTSSTTASPMSNLTREQAAVILSRNLMLRETTGESLGFSDSRGLSEWSRGLIASAVAEGVINGYSDGTFRPLNNITRGEVAAMLVRAIGTPIDKKGDHSLGDVYGNVTISSSDVNLRNTTIVGNLYLTGGIDLGNVLLENVTVLGRIIVSGAGESNASQSSVVLRNVEADEMVVDSIKNQFVTIRAEGNTDIPLTSVRTNAYLDDSSWAGYGLTRIEVDGESGLKVQLAGSIKEVVNVTPSSDLQLVQGSAEKVTIDEYAKNSSVLVDAGTRMDELNLDVATLVTGKGDIKNLNIGASGCDVDILPENVVIRPGIIAIIDGKEMGSLDASESSAEPKLMAGYPNVRNISPTGAEGVFSVNKPGTVYWAISAVADGSVSEEDLISPPSYGGNIFQKQSGQINASNARTEYQSIIASLNSDGSYYISAILVDGRGNRSPVKVASFSTPDSTVPAFLKYEKTKETTQTAQVTVMTNKNCQLYWALLSAGSAAPTPQEFKSGSISGNWGYGSVNAVKNVSMSINVNRVRLREKTEYVLYLWLTDYDGAQSMAAPVSLTFFTPDETPPIVAAPTQTEYGESTAGITFSINEVPSTLYWAVVPEGNETFIAPGTDMSDLRTKIKVTSGTGATSFGSMAAAGANVDTKFTVSNLITANTNTNNYTLYYVARDAAGNYSDEVRSISIRTLDTTPPTVTQEFTKVNGDKLNEPLADTDIRLVFSETVKGGSAATKTFLELYQDVVAAQNAPTIGGSTLEQARKALGDALAEHIKMYTVPRDGRAVEVIQRTRDDQTDWVVDWRYAQVKMESVGNANNMVIILPTTDDIPGNYSALKLESGVSYYFHLEGVYDNAYNPNGVMGNRLGNYDLPLFKTVYAQVTMVRNADVDEISGGNYDGTRLDMCLDLIPSSTSKVPDTERWDMILWSDTSVRLKLYRQVKEKNGTWSEWELVNNPTEPARIDVTNNNKNPAVGMGYRIQGDDANKGSFAPLKTGLEEGKTYRYGIHFTQVNNTNEENPKERPKSWSELVTMKFALIAGGRGNVYDVSVLPNDNFEPYVNNGSVSSIGVAFTATGSEDTLTISKQFTDERVPEFTTGYPKITPGSGTIHMEVNLDRDVGTIYYVVAPADDGIPTSVVTKDGGVEFITPTIGGVAGNDTDNKTEGRLTYIPEDGKDRETNAPYIAFKSTDNVRNKYASPTYRNITDPKYGADSDVYVGTPIQYRGATVSVDIPNRKPQTQYYIYFVRQGGGAPSEIVEIYRTTTTEVKVPSVTVTGTSTTATMTPSEDCQLSFALVELNKLPIFIRTASAGDKSILDMMRTRSSGMNSKSEFDVSGTPEQKKMVAEYVLGSSQGTDTAPVGIWTLPDGKDYKDPIKGGQHVLWSFEKEMTAPKSEYVVLAIGRHIYGGTGGDDYGFGAVRGLFTPDKEPPEFNDKLVEAIINKCSNPKDPQDWSNLPERWTYNGTVSLVFSKNLYYHDTSNNQLYQLWPAQPTTDDEKNIAKGYKDVIGGTAAFNKKIIWPTTGKEINGSITLKFKDMRIGDTIEVPSSGQLSNGSDYTMPYRLRLTFDPTLRANQYSDEVFLDFYAPGFRVEKIPSN